MMEILIRSTRIARLWLQAKASGTRTGDGTSVGLFVPLPKELASKLPDLSPQDDSPSHMTFLVCGDIRGREKEFVQVTRDVFEAFPWTSVRATLGGVDFFEHPKWGLVSHLEVNLDPDLTGFRRVLLAEYSAKGFYFETKFAEFRPHVTLSYGEEISNSSLFDSQWDFNSIEIWGLPEVYTIPFGKGKIAKYKAKKKLENGTEIRIYGPRQISNRHKEKANKLENLKKQISDLRAKVKKDLDRGEDTALVIALIDETFERVGNPQSAKDGHFGVTGWRKKHLTFKGDKAILKYVGKSGVSQEKEIKDKKLVSLLKDRSEGLSPEDELFPSIESKDVNEYLKPFGATAKDIRGFHANSTMKEMLKKQRAKGPKELPFSRKEKDKILKEEFKKALEETAILVGHEASTLKSQYLVPGLEDSYIHDGTIMDTMVEKKGTKSRTEKEDEQAAKMLRREPRKKPPRYDLRKNQTLEERDPDLEGLNSGDHGDRDLSMKSTKVARLWLLKKSKENPHKEGDVWKVQSGWRAMNEEGTSQTFEDEESAKIFAKGAENDSEEDLEEEEIEQEEESEGSEDSVKTFDAKSALKKIEEIGSQLLKGEINLDKSVSDSLEKSLSKLSETEANEFSKNFGDSLKLLISQDGFSASMVKDANKSLHFNFFEAKGPLELGIAVAQLLFAKNVTANPLILGGVKVSKDPKSSKELSQRAEQSFSHFKRLDPILISHAAETLSNALKPFDEESDDPEEKELQAILSGLHLASIVKTGKGVSGRPEPSKGMVSALQKMVKEGKASELFSLTEDFYKPEHQGKFKELIRELPTDEFFSLVSDEGKDSPYKPLKELMEGDLAPEWKSLLKDWVAEDYMKDITWHDSALRDVLKHNGEEEQNSDSRFELLKEMRDSWKEKLFKEWQDCLSGSSDEESKKDCKDRFSEASMILQSAQSSKDFLDRLSAIGYNIPNTVSVAALDHFIETGDSNILESPLEPHPETFSGRKSHLSSYRRSLADRNSAQRNFFMTKFSKRASRNVIAAIDQMAEFFEKRGSEIIGVDPKIAKDLARRLDMMSSLMEHNLKMAFQDTVDPVSNYTLTPKVPTNFESDDIGAQDPGALMRDSDEPYDDVFKQDEFRQLREVQQGGEFSNAKAAARLILKQAALLEQMGVKLSSKKK